MERAMERTQSPATTPASCPVTFPESYPFALISQLPKSAPQTPNRDKGAYHAGLGETAVVLLVLVLSSPKKLLQSFFDGVVDFEGPEKLTSLLLKLFKVASSILSNDAWPSNWLNINILAHKVLIKIFDPVGTILEQKYIPTDQNGPAFDTVLWKEAFSVLLRLLSSEQLVIEDFSPQVSRDDVHMCRHLQRRRAINQKRRAVWRLASDIRGEGAAILLRLWTALGWPTEEPEGGSVTRVQVSPAVVWSSGSF